MPAATYKMSFVAGALLYLESVKIAELFSIWKQWEKVQEIALAQNTLQARAISTLKRLTREVVLRLETLNEQELALFIEATYRDQKYLLWLALCRRYTFIGDFATEVLLDRFLSLKNTVTYADYMAFFNQKAEWHEEVDRLAASTRHKLRQTLFLMMREANLLDRKQNIIPVYPGAALRKVLTSAERRETLFFPIPAMIKPMG